MAQTAAERELGSFRAKFYLAVGSIGWGVKDAGITSLLLLYYAQVVGVPAQLVGLAIGAALVFDAVIDKVEVKSLGELSPNEIEHDNPELRHAEEIARFLGQLYNREVTAEDTVTLIRFSAIKPRDSF